jgi:hypothetical protein
MPTQAIRHRRALAEIAQRSTPHAQTWRDLSPDYDDVEGDGIRMIRSAAAAAAVGLAIVGPLVYFSIEVLVAAL